jgi:oligogalacturonide lyase
VGSGKGALADCEAATFTEAATGATVHRITGHAAISHPSYFLQRSFFPGDGSLFFTSYRTGSPQLFETGFPEGPIRQLTDGPAIHPFSAALHPGGEEIVFTRGGSLWAIRRDTLDERSIVNFPDAQLGECSMTAGGEWLTAAARRGVERGLVVGRFDGSAWRFLPFPRTVIHPQFHPLEPEWIEFAGDPAPRMHRIRRDGSGLECIYEHGNDEFVVHETFLGRTGDLVFTVWPRALCRMDWTSREIRTIAEFNAWHITPNRAGTEILCDTNHPDLGLHIVDAATGRRRRICLSEASNQGTQWRTSRYALAEDFAAARGASKSGSLSWMEMDSDTVYGPQWSHPHPSWSNDERKICFASDRTGTAQVYVAEIPTQDATPGA